MNQSCAPMVTTKSTPSSCFSTGSSFRNARNAFAKLSQSQSPKGFPNKMYMAQASAEKSATANSAATQRSCGDDRACRGFKTSGWRRAWATWLSSEWQRARSISLTAFAPGALTPARPTRSSLQRNAARPVVASRELGTTSFLFFLTILGGPVDNKLLESRG